MTIQTVGVIGAGQMGNGIAHVFALAGYDVVMTDISQDALNKAIALIDRNVPVVVVAPRDALFEKTVSNMQEVMARGGQVLLVTDREGAKVAGQGVWETLVLPDVAPLWAPILYAVPAQLLAYHTAMAKGTDVDQPRNLAKSVTVE